MIDKNNPPSGRHCIAESRFVSAERDRSFFNRFTTLYPKMLFLFPSVCAVPPSLQRCDSAVTCNMGKPNDVSSSFTSQSGAEYTAAVSVPHSLDVIKAPDSTKDRISE